jgi:hypothetical protein
MSEKGSEVSETEASPTANANRSRAFNKFKKIEFSDSIRSAQLRQKFVTPIPTSKESDLILLQLPPSIPKPFPSP